MSSIKNTEHYFGGCPECGGTDGYMNFRNYHWFVCDKHLTKWCVGTNLFSGWREETEEHWNQVAEKLVFHREVEPLPMVQEAARA